MGILEFVRSKLNKTADGEIIIEEEMVKEEPAQDESAKEDTKCPFIEPFSMLELSEADWAEFGAMLKVKRLLPNSYDRKPAEVNILLDGANLPMVELVFKSKTSDSIRKLHLIQKSTNYPGNVREFVNDSPMAKHDEERSTELNDEWRAFQYGLRNQLEFKQRIIASDQRIKARDMITEANKLIREANKLMNFEEFFEREKEFLEKHMLEVYDWFYYPGWCMSDSPAFHNDFGDLVVPFSPKTLEDCVLKLSYEAKCSEAEDIEYFKEKCRDVAECSGYETEEWKKTITRLSKMLERTLQKYGNLQESAEMAE